MRPFHGQTCFFVAELSVNYRHCLVRIQYVPHGVVPNAEIVIETRFYSQELINAKTWRARRGMMGIMTCKGEKLSGFANPSFLILPSTDLVHHCHGIGEDSIGLNTCVVAIKFAKKGLSSTRIHSSLNNAPSLNDLAKQFPSLLFPFCLSLLSSHTRNQLSLLSRASRTTSETISQNMLS